MFLFLCFPDEDKVKYVTGSGSDGTPFYKSDDFYCKTRSCTLTVQFSSCLLTLDSLLTRIHQGVKGLQAPDTRSNIGTLCDLWTLISQIHVSLWNLYLSSASWHFWGLWGQIWFILIHSYFTLGNVSLCLWLCQDHKFTVSDAPVKVKAHLRVWFGFRSSLCQYECVQTEKQSWISTAARGFYEVYKTAVSHRFCRTHISNCSRVSLIRTDSFSASL